MQLPDSYRVPFGYPLAATESIASIEIAESRLVAIGYPWIPGSRAIGLLIAALLFDAWQRAKG